MIFFLFAKVRVAHEGRTTLMKRTFESGERRERGF